MSSIANIHIRIPKEEQVRGRPFPAWHYSHGCYLMPCCSSATLEWASSLRQVRCLDQLTATSLHHCCLLLQSQLHVWWQNDDHSRPGPVQGTKLKPKLSQVMAVIIMTHISFHDFLQCGTMWSEYPGSSASSEYPLKWDKAPKSSWQQKLAVWQEWGFWVWYVLGFDITFLQKVCK